MKWVVDKNNFKGYAKTGLMENGRCMYSGKSETEYIAEGYAIVSDDEYFAMVHEWENTLCGRWKEITAENFNDMLCVLPPIGWYDGGFFVGEAYTGDVYTFCQQLDGKYYSSLQHVRTPRNDIIEDLRKFIAKG